MNKIGCLLFALVLLSGDICAETPIDSIRREMKHLGGAELLKAHDNLCGLAFAQNDSLQELAFLDAYMKEARKQESLKDEAYARSCKLVCYYNYNMDDELLASMPEHLDFMASHQLWSDYYNSRMLLFDMYLYKNQYHTALREAENAYADAQLRNVGYGLGVASYNMGMVYQHLQNTDEAEKAFKRAIQLLSDEEDKTVLMYAYENYGEVLSGKSDYEGLKKLTAEWKRVLDILKSQYEEKGYLTSELDCKYRYYYEAVAEVEMETGDLVKAHCLLQRADSLTRGNPPVARLSLLRLLARYHELTSEYDTALAYNKQRMDLDSASHNYRGLLDAKEQRATLLCSAGRYAEAAHIYRDVIPVRDSFMTATTATQLNELNTLYKVNELTFQKKLTTNRLYCAVACSTLLLLIVIIYIIYTHRLRDKNRALYNIITQKESAQAKRWSAMVQIPEEQQETDERLFSELSRIMLEEELFKDTELNREMLAARLNTNRTYLADAVRKHANGATLTGFINDYRLRYAAALLTNDPSKSVSEVNFSSGFNSRSTFCRLFRDYYGMSPSEYRAISKEKMVRPTPAMDK